MLSGICELNYYKSRREQYEILYDYRQNYSAKDETLPSLWIDVGKPEYSTDEHYDDA